MCWPNSLKLSKLGHKIFIVDNLCRRKIDIDLESNSLTPIKTITQRINKWKEITGLEIIFENIDVAKEYHKFCDFIKKNNIEVIIHFGEQRSAPYSMKNDKTRLFTVENNLMATHNILNAIVEINRDIHLIHLGTMGVYGYGSVPNTVIPEGYISVKMKDNDNNEKEVEILHPAYPGSVYHMTKTQDALFFQFYAKNWSLKITDLHQGIVWGLETPETKLHPDLINRLDYDSDYGTVLNRFIMQSVYDIPLTIYGSGGQTRAFIHIIDCTNCISLAVDNPPELIYNQNGECIPMQVKIFNQVSETHTIKDPALLIKNIYPNTQIDYIKNPRKELNKNDLKVSNQNFLNLGLEPILLNKEKINEIYQAIEQYKNNIYIDHQKVLPSSFW